MTRRMYNQPVTVKSHCPFCGHNKALVKNPKKCSKCGMINKGWETKKNKHGKTITIPIK